jgi:hypothetical protein
MGFGAAKELYIVAGVWGGALYLSPGHGVRDNPRWHLAVSYEIKEIDGKTYLFIEEKSTDGKTCCYVFEKTSDDAPALSWELEGNERFYLTITEKA